MANLVNIMDVIVDNNDPLKPQQYATLGDIKSYIDKQVGVRFNLDTDPTTGEGFKFIAFFDEAKKSIIEQKLNELKSSRVLNFRIEWYEPSNKYIVVIAKVNPKLESYQEQEIKQQCEIQMAAPSQVTNPVVRQQQLIETNLTDIDLVKSTILSVGEEFKKLTINGIPIDIFVMQNFDKYSSIADVLVMECICDGKLSLLQNIMSVRHSATVTQTEIQRSFKGRLFDNIDAEIPQIISERIREQRHSYQLKINFDVQSFATYVKAKKSLGKEKEFLGDKEEVKKCLEFICGDGSARISAIMTALQNAQAFKSVESLFTF